MSSSFYVVATPIGNLEDMTARARRILGEVSLIAAEDTRHTGRLLQACGIRTRMIAYHDHSDQRAVEAVLATLRAGDDAALVSDAGTPAISDPGFGLIRSVQDAGFSVVPVPGACAAITGLSGSGIPSDRFFFEGFLPSRADARIARLTQLAGLAHSVIIYEAPHRLEASVAAISEVFGADREMALARELTKTFETIRRGPVGELLAWIRQDPNQERGEIVLIIGPAARHTEKIITPEVSALLQTLAAHLPARKAAKLVGAATSHRTSALYDFLLELRKG